jgi:hypothetical protein
MNKFLISEYNPLVKDNSWVYLKNNKSKLSHFVFGDVNLNGLSVQKVISSDGTTVYLKNEDGLNTYVIEKKAGVLTYDPPISLSPKEISIGEVHEYVSKITFSILGLRLNFGNIFGANELIGIEDVSVPAGNFKKCLKFESTAFRKGWLGINYKLTIWFAKDVGEVKCEFTTKIAGITSRVKKELITAIVGNVHFPIKLN